MSKSLMKPAGRTLPAALMAIVATGGVARAEGPFVLSDEAMDSVTAAGVEVLANADAFATAFGPRGVSMSFSDTSIRPDLAVAVGDALAGGDDGGYVQAFGGILVRMDSGGAFVDSGAVADVVPGGDLARATIEAGATIVGASIQLLSASAASGDSTLSAGAIGAVEAGGALEAYGGGSGTHSGTRLEGGLRSAGPVTHVTATGLSHGQTDADMVAAASLTVDGPDGPITMTATQEGFGIGDGSKTTGVVRITAVSAGPITVMRSMARGRGDGADGGSASALTAASLPDGGTQPLQLRTREGAGLGQGGATSSTTMIMLARPAGAPLR